MGENEFRLLNTGALYFRNSEGMYVRLGEISDVTIHQPVEGEPHDDTIHGSRAATAFYYAPPEDESQAEAIEQNQEREELWLAAMDGV